MTEAERLTRLEERYAHLQKHVGQQDKAMLELGDALRRVTRELKSLREQRNARSEAAGDVGDDLPDERPPHY